MKECWVVIDKAKYYIVKTQDGKREVVFTCPSGHLITTAVCSVCNGNTDCPARHEAEKYKEDAEK